MCTAIFTTNIRILDAFTSLATAYDGYRSREFLQPSLPPLRPPRNWRWFHRFQPALQEADRVDDVCLRAGALLRRLLMSSVVERVRHKRKRRVQGLRGAFA